MLKLSDGDLGRSVGLFLERSGRCLLGVLGLSKQSWHVSDLGSVVELWSLLMVLEISYGRAFLKDGILINV